MDPSLDSIVGKRRASGRLFAFVIASIALRSAPFPSQASTMRRDEPSFTDPWYAKPGFVYFIGAGEPLKAIKIGVTVATGFKSRLRGHQSSNHEPLRVLGLIAFDGPDRNMRVAEQLEQSLHKRFAAHQRFQASWVGSEWFNPHPDILDYIRDHCTSCSALGLPDTFAKNGPGLSGGA